MILSCVVQLSSKTYLFEHRYYLLFSPLNKVFGDDDITKLIFLLEIRNGKIYLENSYHLTILTLYSFKSHLLELPVNSISFFLFPTNLTLPSLAAGWRVHWRHWRHGETASFSSSLISTLAFIYIHLLSFSSGDSSLSPLRLMSSLVLKTKLP